MLKENEIALDFETFYSASYSVAEMGYHAYTHDERFNAYLVSWVDSSSKGAQDPRLFDWSKVHDKTVIAHNAAFDKAVFDRLVELRVVPADVKPSGWLCTAAMSAYCQCPRSLKDSAKAILGKEISKAARDAAKGRSGEDLFGSMAEYALADAEACAELWARAGQYWPYSERRLWRITLEMGERGVKIDRPYLEVQIGKAHELANDAITRIPWAGQEQPTSPKAMQTYLKSKGLPVPPSTNDGDPEFLAWRDAHQGEASNIVAAMQDYRSANRSLKILLAMRDRIKPDGRMEAHLMYCGAFTGRWSGGGHGLNLQNLNADAEMGDSRGCIIAADKSYLVTVDLAQIEARILLWLVGDQTTLDYIRGGMSVYEAHARATMGWTGGKLKHEDPGLYKLAKCRVLGLGYGCGAVKFKTLAKAMAGIDLSEDECKRIVADYRASNPGIEAFWRAQQSEIDRRDGGRYDARLKSGRYLAYRSISKLERSAEQVKGTPAKVYGGLIVENIVQATARDLFADRLLALVDAGFTPVMLVHDEYVLEVPANDHEHAEREMFRAMDIIRNVPAWAAGLPVECEGKVLGRYEK